MLKTHRKTTVFALAVGAGIAVLGASSSQQAYAATANWGTNNATINYNGETFQGPLDGTSTGGQKYEYVSKTQPNGCNSPGPDVTPQPDSSGLDTRDYFVFASDPTKGGNSASSADFYQIDPVSCTTIKSRSTVTIAGGSTNNGGGGGGTTAPPPPDTTTSEWLDYATINYHGQTFTGPFNGQGSSVAYKAINGVQCKDSGGNTVTRWSVISFSANPTAAGASASPGTLDEWTQANGSGNCTEKPNQTITIANAQNAKLTKTQMTCQSRAQGSDYNSCVQITAQSICSGVDGAAQSTCIQKETAGLGQDGAAVTANSDLTAQNGAAANPADTKPSCEASGFNLSWIACPIFNGLAGLTSWIVDNILTPMLQTTPISTSGTNNIYKVWSNFRIYGNIFLVIALIIIVFGQSIGGGIVDAYTAKKVLPRLLIATILINLSIYIVAGLVDITNVVGGGIGQLMTAPISQAGAFKIHMSGGGADIIGASALFAGVGGLALMLGGVTIMPFILLFVVLPVVLAVIMIMVTLVIRQALITALVLVSPVAFALYCLPNTEKYFKKWWELLVQTLIVYPIVIVFFSVASILSVTVDPNASAANTIISLLLQFLPLMFIPYAFKLAGGVLGRIHELAAGKAKQGLEAVKGNPNDPNSLRNRVKYNTRSSYNAARSNAYAALSDKTKAAKGDTTLTRGGRFRRGAYGLLARGVGYGNLEADRAQYNEQQEKIIAAQYSQGGDNTVRAYWAKKATAEDAAQGDGRIEGRYYSPYQNADGTYKEWSKADVDKAHAIVGNDQSRVQSYAKYEMGKAANDGQLDAFESRFETKADEMGWSENTANGVYAGIKFAHQQTRKERKYQNLERDASTGKLKFGKIDHAGLSNELADTSRRGDFASYRSSTGKAALEGYQTAQANLASGGAEYAASAAGLKDQEVVKNYQEVAANLEKAFYGVGGPGGKRAAIEKQHAAEIAAATGGEAGDVESGGYGLGASARAEQAWLEFVQAVRPQPSGNGGSGTPPASGGSSGGGRSGNVPGKPYL